MQSGRTVPAEFIHRWRGWCQFWLDVEHLYPRRIVIASACIGLLIITLAWWRYHATENHRLLVGHQLQLAHETMAAIRIADNASEDFSNIPVRRRAFIEASTQIETFKQYARTEEEMRASTVFAYYFDEVRQIPERDVECAVAMQAAQQVGATGSATRDELVKAAVGELSCMSGRSQAVAIKNLCRDEALSYMIPGRQPPVDACVFRHMAQVDAPR